MSLGSSKWPLRWNGRCTCVSLSPIHVSLLQVVDVFKFSTNNHECPLPINLIPLAESVDWIPGNTSFTGQILEVWTRFRILTVFALTCNDSYFLSKTVTMHTLPFHIRRSPSLSPDQFLLSIRSARHLRSFSIKTAFLVVSKGRLKSVFFCRLELIAHVHINYRNRMI